MKLSFLRNKTRLLLQKNSGPRGGVTYPSALNLGIIFTVEDKQKHHTVKTFIKRLEQDGKNIQVLEYLPEKKDNYEFKFDFFTDKDFSLLGNLRSSSAIQFTNSPFDILFCIDLNPNALIQYILAKSKAKCRVGTYWESGEPFLDLMIRSVSTYPALIDNMYKYTAQLK